MAIAILWWMLAIPLLGLATGLRAMTPMAVLCWFAYLGYLSVAGTWAAWTAHPAWLAIFTFLALGEYVGDKLPQTPNRTSPAPLAARLVLGGLSGAIAATALKGSGLEGTLLGLGGAGLGAFGGFMIRRNLIERSGGDDWKVAVGEDIIAVLLAVSGLHMITN